MNYRKLGKTDLLVSETGLGTWGISGNGYGPTDDKESLSVIHKALDLGVNFIDTADSYGNGHSEELIGKVLANRGDKETIVATKFGWDFYTNSGIRSNLKEKYIGFALEHSLKRLKRDWIDIYKIHSSKPDNIENFNVYETLEKLKKQGKIRHYGISIQYISDGFRAMEIGKIETIQLPYNLLNQETEELIQSAAENNIGIITREPLASGLLTGKYNSGSKFHKKDHRNGWSSEFLNYKLDRIKKFQSLVNENRKLQQVAISFVLNNKKVSTAIPGAKTVNQVIENLNASKEMLSQTEINKIKSLYKKNS